jgi:hypothetical protein
MARGLISAFTNRGDTVYDPFSGSGTVALESWILGRNVIANDLSPYAALLTSAKLFPSFSLAEALAEIDLVSKLASQLSPRIDLRKVPKRVRVFFHPDTLRETIAWSQILKSRESNFVLACLLGILHHQRPGFLSYPSSHTVPYLREQRFPRSKFPGLYEYRTLRDRLERKVARALRRFPNLDLQVSRVCRMADAAKFVPKQRVEAIITSPPYMRQLDYGRDNRLRLWFLGIDDWQSLDERVSLREKDFLHLIRRCLAVWQNVLIPNGLCVLVVGEASLPTTRAMERRCDDNGAVVLQFGDSTGNGGKRAVYPTNNVCDCRGSTACGVSSPRGTRRGLCYRKLIFLLDGALRGGYSGGRSLTRTVAE